MNTAWPLIIEKDRLVHLVIIHAAFWSTNPVIQARPKQVYPVERFLYCLEETIRKDLGIPSIIRSPILVVLYIIDERNFSQ